MTRRRTTARTRRALPVLLLVLGLTACSTAGGAPTASESASSAAPSVTTNASPAAIDGCLPADQAAALDITVDGRPLTAVALGRGNRVVVLSNQSDSALCGWLPEGRRLAALGYRVVMWDQGAVDWADAISAVVEHARKNGATAVDLVGASKGGWASAIAAGTITPPVQGLISLSGESELHGVSVNEQVRAYRGPLLVISATGDDFAADTLTLYPRLHRGSTTVLSLDGADHGWELLHDKHAARVRQAIDAFLARTLG